MRIGTRLSRQQHQRVATHGLRTKLMINPELDTIRLPKFRTRFSNEMLVPAATVEQSREARTRAFSGKLTPALLAAAR